MQSKNQNKLLFNKPKKPTNTMTNEETKKPITWAELKRFCNKLPEKFMNEAVLFEHENGAAYINAVERKNEPHILTDYGVEPKSAYSANQRKGYPIVWRKGHPFLWSDEHKGVQ